MKTLVAYMSRTGNTRKVAEAIFGELDDEKELKPVEEVGSIEGYDVAFMGFPIERMGPTRKAAQALERCCVDGRKVVLFITHAAAEDSRDLPPMLEKFRQAARGATVVDMFHCQGQLDKTTKRIMSLLPNARFRTWAREDNSMGQPDEGRLERARVFARDVMKTLGGTAQ